MTRRQKGTPRLRVLVDEVRARKLSSSVDAIVAEGARRMLADALDA